MSAGFNAVKIRLPAFTSVGVEPRVEIDGVEIKALMSVKIEARPDALTVVELTFAASAEMECGDS